LIDIDEELHKIQYIIDHCKRLLEGNQTNNSPSILFQNKLIKEEIKKEILFGIKNLDNISKHLLDHIDAKVISSCDLKEIHSHINEFEANIRIFHDNIELTNFSKWKRKKLIPIPKAGSKISLSLVIPIVIDCIIDGSLIGLSCALRFDLHNFYIYILYNI
jgi:CRISPR/Cas system-associated exonuclease Cas4 (RecB family)